MYKLLKYIGWPTKKSDHTRKSWSLFYKIKGVIYNESGRIKEKSGI